MYIGARVIDIKDSKEGIILAFSNETPIPALMQATVQMNGEIRVLNLSRLRMAPAE